MGVTLEKVQADLRAIFADEEVADGLFLAATYRKDVADRLLSTLDTIDGMPEIPDGFLILEHMDTLGIISEYDFADGDIDLAGVRGVLRRTAASRRTQAV